MKLDQLISGLSSPTVYPHPVDSVRICQTHISVVFLAGPYAYKIKKPVQFDFLDFSNLEAREHFCREEVRLNRRAAPNVYLGVTPITQEGDSIRVEGAGDPIEWAVKMRRLPDEASLKYALLHGNLDRPTVETLARRVARFHASAAAGPAIAEFGRFDVVASNVRENLSHLSSFVDRVVSRSVLERLSALAEAHLTRLRPVIERRAQGGMPRDTHGDLRLEHVYWFPDKSDPDDLAIIDCIEFNERFRFADPVADMAFLVMDFAACGRRDLAEIFANAYFEAGGDEEGRLLLSFYVAYRAAVRAKVGAIKCDEPEVSPTEREGTLARSRARAVQALFELEQPGKRPCLILMAGLPGTGKSTLANDLAQNVRLRVIRTDVVRKELASAAGMAPELNTLSGEAIYTEDWTERTYAECLRRAEALLFEGERVIVDGNFRQRPQRRAFREAAERWGVPFAVLVCKTTPETAQRRLANRRGDPSDADWTIHQRLAEQWQEPNDDELRFVHAINTEGSPGDALEQALFALRAERLH